MATAGARESEGAASPGRAVSVVCAECWAPLSAEEVAGHTGHEIVGLSAGGREDLLRRLHAKAEHAHAHHGSLAHAAARLHQLQKAHDARCDEARRGVRELAKEAVDKAGSLEKVVAGATERQQSELHNAHTTAAHVAHTIQHHALERLLLSAKREVGASGDEFARAVAHSAGVLNQALQCPVPSVATWVANTTHTSVLGRGVDDLRKRLACAGDLASIGFDERGHVVLSDEARQFGEAESDKQEAKSAGPEVEGGKGGVVDGEREAEEKAEEDGDGDEEEKGEDEDGEGDGDEESAEGEGQGGKEAEKAAQDSDSGGNEAAPGGERAHEGKCMALLHRLERDPSPDHALRVLSQLRDALLSTDVESRSDFARSEWAVVLEELATLGAAPVQALAMTCIAAACANTNDAVGAANQRRMHDVLCGSGIGLVSFLARCVAGTRLHSLNANTVLCVPAVVALADILCDAPLALKQQAGQGPLLDAAARLVFDDTPIVANTAARVLGAVALYVQPSTVQRVVEGLMGRLAHPSATHSLALLSSLATGEGFAEAIASDKNIATLLALERATPNHGPIANPLVSASLGVCLSPSSSLLPPPPVDAASVFWVFAEVASHSSRAHGLVHSALVREALRMANTHATTPGLSASNAVLAAATVLHRLLGHSVLDSSLSEVLREGGLVCGVVSLLFATAVPTQCLACKCVAELAKAPVLLSSAISDPHCVPRVVELLSSSQAALEVAACHALTPLAQAGPQERLLVVSLSVAAPLFAVALRSHSSNLPASIALSWLMGRGEVQEDVVFAEWEAHSGHVGTLLSAPSPRIKAVAVVLCLAAHRALPLANRPLTVLSLDQVLAVALSLLRGELEHDELLGVVGAIQHTAQDGSSGVCEGIGASGVVEVLVGLLTHASDVVVAAVALALKAIASGPINKAVVSKANGVPSLLYAAHAHEHDNAVVGNCCWALKNLTSSDSIARLVEPADLQLLVALLRAKAAVEHEAVVQRVCALLCNVVIDEANAGVVQQCGGVDVLLGLMRDPHFSHTTLAYACWVLKNLSVDPDIAGQLVESGAVGTLARFLEPRVLDGLLVQACWTLWNLTERNDVVQLVADECADKLYGVLLDNTDARVCLYAIRVIGNLAAAPEVAQQLRMLELDKVVDAMEAHPDSEVSTTAASVGRMFLGRR